MIAIIDYDTGNLYSVENLLRGLNCNYEITSDKERIAAAERVILPGVGQARMAMEKLRERGLDTLIPTLTQPVLGICIGVQLMCRHSEEGDVECMGIFDADVKRFVGEGIKIPHMGWNTINSLQSPLFEGVTEGSYIYYVHSYAPTLCSSTIATTTYGTTFSGALQRDNFFGTQFHPEKSGDIGAKIVQNFINLK